MSLRLVVLLLVSLLSLDATVAQTELNCLADSERVSLYEALQSEAYAALDRRIDQLESIKSPEEIAAYQQRLRSEFVKRLGGFPDRGPLNSQTIKTIDANGYRIEKVIFESRPQHHITANFYVPRGDGPFPGVVVSSGHSRTAKTADYNQRFGIMLARCGIAALCFDPIGQGERSQILNDRGENQISGTTTEHFLVGLGSILVGRNTATYRVHDAMRAIDYLVARPEIDASRIGMTGCSGGGTLTSYTMAIDDRVACAAPACYLTNFRRLIETIGPQDAEQNIFGQIAWGMDQTDYVLIRAPKPTLISSTTQDFFDVSGSWETFRQAKQIYGRLGFPERVDLVEVEGKHGVTPQNLATIAHWMQRWLLDRDEPVRAIELEVRNGDDLLCTERGQVLLLPNELSVFDLNAREAERLAVARADHWRSASPEQRRKQVADRIGLRNTDSKSILRNVSQQQLDDYQIEAVVLRTETATPLPMHWYKPKRPSSRDLYLCLHDGGKRGAAELAVSLVRQGHNAITVDLRGQGETASGESSAPLGDWKTFYLAYLLEQSIVGIRTQDVLAITQHLAETMHDGNIHLIAQGQSGLVALHAAAVSPERFADVELKQTPKDWTSDVGTHEPASHLDHTVHGALEDYDLPDLVSLIGEDKVRYAE